MKIFSLISLSIILFSCKSTNIQEEKPSCPKGYDCYTELIKGKSISLFKDSIGKDYIKLEKNENYNVIKYIYKYKGNPKIADDSYLETIHFEMPASAKELNLEDKELSQAKLIAQKSCFCKDAGYELITQGELSVSKSKKAYEVNIDFESKKNIKVKSVQTRVKI